MAYGNVEGSARLADGRHIKRNRARRLRVIHLVTLFDITRASLAHRSAAHSRTYHNGDVVIVVLLMTTRCNMPVICIFARLYILSATLLPQRITPPL